MPSESKAQRRLMAIAEHHPEQVYARNHGVLKMSDRQLSDYAGTSEKKLPKRKSPTTSRVKGTLGSLVK